MERHTYTAFSEQRRVASGPIEDVALKVKQWIERGGAQVLIFEDLSGQQIDLDLRGTDEDALARLGEHPWLQHRADDKRSGPGRPKLGVVSREVSLLPRHWEWLNAQRGGASVTLRRLVEESMKGSEGQDRARKAGEAVSKFMWALGGNLPGFEEASRALSRKEYERLEGEIAGWPADIRDHVRRLAKTAQQAEAEAHRES